jgi:hypothetical protein
MHTLDTILGGLFHLFSLKESPFFVANETTQFQENLLARHRAKISAKRPHQSLDISNDMNDGIHRQEYQPVTSSKLSYLSLAIKVATYGIFTAVTFLSTIAFYATVVNLHSWLLMNQNYVLSTITDLVWIPIKTLLTLGLVKLCLKVRLPSVLYIAIFI